MTDKETLTNSSNKSNKSSKMESLFENIVDDISKYDNKDNVIQVKKPEVLIDGYLLIKNVVF